MNIDLNRISGMNTHYSFYTIDDYFSSLEKLNIKNAELWTFNSHFFLDYNLYQNTKEIKEKSKKHNLKIICITPEQNNPKPYNIATSFPHLKEKTLNYFKNAVRAANELECNKVLVTSGWAFYSENLEEARKRSADMVQNICEFASEKGVTIVIETLRYDESHIVYNIPTLKEYMKMVNHPNLKITIDTGAMACAGESVRKFYEAFGDKIAHVHFVDGTPKGHLVLGEGNLPIEEYLQDFNENHYRGYFSLEITHEKYYNNPQLADKNNMSYLVELSKR
ncbi:sugar phosphate isomerase/epimerase family protein [Clostridium neuense]|uniref:Sugar phosphate isomerase/epimerase family protein n=1 Tax=Clostridium neuense TaxID=1728934 RepID=A0ABW8TMG6_9CLOT